MKQKNRHTGMMTPMSKKQTTVDNIFRPSVINIFTDASTDGGTDACAGCIIVIGELDDNPNVIENYIYCPDTNSSAGEVAAIELGLETALPYISSSETVVRIFTDYLPIVQILRNGIQYVTPKESGMLAMKKKDYSDNFSSHLVRVGEMIQEYQIYLEVYHIKAHCNPDDIFSMTEACRTFGQYNYNNPNAIGAHGLRLIQQLVIFNNMVDERSRDFLATQGRSNPYIRYLYDPFMYVADTFDGNEIAKHIVKKTR